VIDFRLSCVCGSAIQRGQKNTPNSFSFRAPKLAPRLLLNNASGGFSGPASRSGVPLEHSPSNNFLPGCRESRKTSLPRHVRLSSQCPVPGFPVSRNRKLETGNWKLALQIVVRGVGAAGISSGRLRRKRAYAAVTSTPYNRITAEMYTQIRKTTTAAIDP
jgi:hypothetical protein